MKKVVLASLLSATALIPFVVQPVAFGQAAQSNIQMSQEEYAKYNACATATAPAVKKDELPADVFTPPAKPKS